MDGEGCCEHVATCPSFLMHISQHSLPFLLSPPLHFLPPLPLPLPLPLSIPPGLLPTTISSRPWPEMVEGVESTLTPRPSQSGSVRCNHSCPRPSSLPSPLSVCSGSSLTRMHQDQCRYTHTHACTRTHAHTNPSLSSPGSGRTGCTLQWLTAGGVWLRPSLPTGDYIITNVQYQK